MTGREALDGDLDWDGDVDSANMVLFLEGWTGAKEPGVGNVLCSEGDLDQDADSADLLLFLSSRTRAQGASDALNSLNASSSDMEPPVLGSEPSPAKAEFVDQIMERLLLDRQMHSPILD